MHVNLEDPAEFRLNLAKSWFVQAPRFNRERDHREWDPRVHERLPSEVMDLQAHVLPRPPRPLKSDQELDAEAAEDAAGVAAAEVGDHPDGAEGDAGGDAHTEAGASSGGGSASSDSSHDSDNTSSSSSSSSS